VADERPVTYRGVHEMTDDQSGTVAAVTTLVGVHLDAVARRARALPPDVREKALALCDREATKT
jgi:acyl-CoA thioester hydrolase